jgi:hypothetical protein
MMKDKEEVRQPNKPNKRDVKEAKMKHSSGSNMHGNGPGHKEGDKARKVASEEGIGTLSNSSRHNLYIDSNIVP